LRYEFGGILAGFVGHAIGLAGDKAVGAEPVALLSRLLLEERDLSRTIHTEVALALQLSHGFVHVEVLGLYSNSIQVSARACKQTRTHANRHTHKGKVP
jgi:hypothetical protein